MVCPPANSSEVSSQSTRPSFRAMKPSRLAAMWIVTFESGSAIVSSRRQVRRLAAPSLARGDPFGGAEATSPIRKPQRHRVHRDAQREPVSDLAEHTKDLGGEDH